MVQAEARVYTSTPVQSAFHYLKDALLSAGFDEAELNRGNYGEVVNLVIWRPNALAYNIEDDGLSAEGFYACGIQGVFSRKDKKKKLTLSWELRLDYEAPSQFGDNTYKLYHVNIQCILRENERRRPTENISFHYNNEPQPAKWDVVRNWIRFVLDLRTLNPPAWATLKSRLDVSEAVIDSINRKTMDWSSPPSSPISQTQNSDNAFDSELKPFARNVWNHWALPNINRHNVCNTTRDIARMRRNSTRGRDTEGSEFNGCTGEVDWDAAGKSRDDLRRSLDSSSSTLRLTRTGSSSTGSDHTRYASEPRASADSREWTRLGSLDEDMAWE